MPPKKHPASSGAGEIWKRYCDTFDDGTNGILSLLPYHHGILKRIADSWDPSIPNLLIYGASGMPMFPILNYLILAPLKRRLVDLKFQHSSFAFNASHMPYTETDAYLYIDMLHPDMPKDGDTLLEFLKTVLPSRCMHLHKHIVVLDNIDVLTGRDAAFAQVMRVLLERYSNNVWFVATTNRVAALEPPILSRFFAIRIPLPSTSEVAAIMRHLGQAPPQPATRNLTDALRGPVDHRTASQAPPLLRPTTLETVRLEAQRLIQVYAPLSQVALGIIQRAPEKKRAALVERLANIEAQYHTRRKGRDIFFYEAMLLVK